MQVTQAYRYELKPDERQRVLLAKHAGCARFAWNWGLARRIKQFEQNEGAARFTNAFAQHRELNRLKATEFPWMYELSKCAPQEALRDLDRAFRHFWRGRKEGREVGFPKFKKKGEHDSFHLTGAIQVKPNKVQLPRLGRLRTKESTAKFVGRILSATVSREADRWFVSLSVIAIRPDPLPVAGQVVGVDVGLNYFAALSNGEKKLAPKPLSAHLKRLQRLSREHSRKEKGSQNRKKSALKLARLHRRIGNIRRDDLHRFSTLLAKTKSVIVVEDLHVKGLMRNGKLARHIGDAGWGEFRRMLAYKTVWYGSRLVVAPRFLATSKICSGCGHRRNELPLSVRAWTCPECGARHDRDTNAAQNLVKWYLSTASFVGIDACGDSSGGRVTRVALSHESLKQEANGIFVHIS
jgi:putative transposase